MRDMRWSWRDLEETPPYVRRFCLDFAAVRARAEQSAANRSRPKPGG